ncbi:MAG: hypothetical protein H6912_07475 [Kordiimonadaceae bacterium]|nr:hypothetical protein [Kordiimonadaceae bacterium]
MNNIPAKNISILLFVGVIGYFLGQVTYEPVSMNNHSDNNRMVAEKANSGSVEVIDKNKISKVTPNNEAKSVVWTNIGPSSFQLADEILAFPVNMPIYDLAFTNYSSYYAKNYGYPESHVIDMPDHIHLIEYRMRTVGRHTECKLNILLDKNLGLDLPNEAYVTQLAFNSTDFIKIVRPKRVAGWQNSEETMLHNMKYLSTNESSLTNEKYKLRNAATSTEYIPPDNMSLARGGMTVGIDEYNPWFYEDLDYISLNIACGPMEIRMQKQPNYYVWLKKKGGRNYSRIVNLFAEDFMIFEIPLSLREKISGYMKSMPAPLYPKSK